MAGAERTKGRDEEDVVREGQQAGTIQPAQPSGDLWGISGVHMADLRLKRINYYLQQ